MRENLWKLRTSRAAASWISRRGRMSCRNRPAQPRVAAHVWIPRYLQSRENVENDNCTKVFWGTRKVVLKPSIGWWDQINVSLGHHTPLSSISMRNIVRRRSIIRDPTHTVHQPKAFIFLANNTAASEQAPVWPQWREMAGSSWYFNDEKNGMIYGWWSGKVSIKSVYSCLFTIIRYLFDWGSAGVSPCFSLFSIYTL